MAVTYSAVLVGAEVKEIEVETYVGQGFSGLNILGVGGDALRDMRERVRAVLERVGVHLPARRIVVNLAPSQVLRLSRTPVVDLEFAVAASVVRALDEARGAAAAPAKEFFLGGLSLSGELRSPENSLVLRSLAALEHPEKAPPCFSLGGSPHVAEPDAVVCFRTFEEWFTARDKERARSRPEVSARDAERDFREREERVGATLDLFSATPELLVALMASAAGAHHILLAGEPGVGKSFALRRLPDLLPPLDRRERLVRELLVGESAVPHERPVRSPHHTTTGAALIGGAQQRLGEVTLAHLGLLFLDELAEFPRQALEGLREPLDAGSVLISRAAGTVRLPACFLLAATTNPCACGYLLSRRKPCRCPQGDSRKYQKKFSGPLLDRFAIQLLLKPVDDHPQVTSPFVEAVRKVHGREGAQGLARRLLRVQREFFSLEVPNAERPVAPLSLPGWLQAQVSRRGERELAGLARTLSALFPEVTAGSDSFWENVASFRALETLLGGTLL